ncbi:MAG: hypothetical protein WBL79_05735 [Bacillota bacterium]|jgi:hypothetical protein|nr:hypothetical protein [Bacillota bacterium]
MQAKRLRKLNVSMIVAVTLVVVTAGACSAQVGGGGNSVGWVFLRVDDLNESLVDAEFNQLPGGMLTWGGYGTVGVGNGKWSIGGWYGGGEAISKPTAGAEPKIATLAFNYGGILVEYSAVDSPKAHVGLGTVLGGGMASLTTKRGMISDFDEALGAASSASVWRPYLLAQPQASIAFPLSALIDITITGGYSFLYSPTGWMDGMTFKDSFDGPMKSAGLPFVQLSFSFGPPPLGI